MTDDSLAQEMPEDRFMSDYMDAFSVNHGNVNDREWLDSHDPKYDEVTHEQRVWAIESVRMVCGGILKGIELLGPMRTQRMMDLINREILDVERLGPFVQDACAVIAGSNEPNLDELRDSDNYQETTRAERDRILYVVASFKRDFMSRGINVSADALVERYSQWRGTNFEQCMPKW